MLDAFKDLIFNPKVEKLHISAGEVWISSKDAQVMSSEDRVLNPGETSLFGITKIPGIDNICFSVSSRFAQAGLNLESLVCDSQVWYANIKNLHPSNKYFFPKGGIDFGRYYSASGLPTSGTELQKIAEEINSGNNTFGKDEKASIINDDTLEIPIVRDYYNQPGGIHKTEPIDLRTIPSGTKRSLVRSVLGNYGRIPEYNSAIPKDGTLRLLFTPLFGVPEGIALIIQNSDSLNSRIIDSRFEHMVIGEFSDDLLKPGESRTEKSLLFKAYKIKA